MCQRLPPTAAADTTHIHTTAVMHQQLMLRSGPAPVPCSRGCRQQRKGVAPGECSLHARAGGSRACSSLCTNQHSIHTLAVEPPAAKRGKHMCCALPCQTQAQQWPGVPPSSPLAAAAAVAGGGRQQHRPSQVAVAAAAAAATTTQLVSCATQQTCWHQRELKAYGWARSSVCMHDACAAGMRMPAQRACMHASGCNPSLLQPLSAPLWTHGAVCCIIS